MRWSSGRVVRLLGSVAVAVALTGVLASGALAAEPSPSAGAGGDPRSSGQGPGLVGQPGVAIAIVVGIGVLAVGATLVYVRATGGPRRS